MSFFLVMRVNGRDGRQPEGGGSSQTSVVIQRTDVPTFCSRPISQDKWESGWLEKGYPTYLQTSGPLCLMSPSRRPAPTLAENWKDVSSFKNNGRLWKLIGLQSFSKRRVFNVGSFWPCNGGTKTVWKNNSVTLAYQNDPKQTALHSEFREHFSISKHW